MFTDLSGPARFVLETDSFYRTISRSWRRMFYEVGPTTALLFLNGNNNSLATYLIIYTLTYVHRSLYLDVFDMFSCICTIQHTSSVIPEHRMCFSQKNIDFYLGKLENIANMLEFLRWRIVQC